MAEVVVSLQQAIDGTLPHVCAISGEAADGAVPMKLGRSATKWRAPTVRIPLSEKVFRKWSRRQNVHIKARVLAAVLASLAVIVAFRNGLLGIAFLVASGAVHVLDLRSERAAVGLQPLLERHQDELHLSGVHESYVEAVEKARSPD